MFFQLEECLRRNHKKLESKRCKNLLFDQEKREAEDNELDYRLMHVCKPMIKRYCMQYSITTEIMECLRQVVHDRDMSRECREIVQERQIEQAEYFELDPELSKHCMEDANKYCSKELKKAENGEEDDGAVFGCLVNRMISREVGDTIIDIFIVS